LELQRELDDKKAEFNCRGDIERSKGIDMLKIQSQNKTLTQELEEFRKKAVHNQGQLIEALRQTEYLQDKCERTWQAWQKSDRKRLREMKGMWDQLPKEIHNKTKPRIGEFELALTCLNLDACPTLPRAKATKEQAEALKYVSQLHKSDEEIEIEDSRILAVVYELE
jgi:hypothetical protein